MLPRPSTATCGWMASVASGRAASPARAGCAAKVSSPPMRVTKMSRIEVLPEFEGPDGLSGTSCYVVIEAALEVGMNRQELPLAAPARAVDVGALKAALAGRFGGEVRFDRLSRALYSTDASVY